MRIPISKAYLCQDCNCIGDAAVQCECGSKALLSLGTALNRESGPKVKFGSNFPRRDKLHCRIRVPRIAFCEQCGHESSHHGESGCYDDVNGRPCGCRLGV